MSAVTAPAAPVTRALLVRRFLADYARNPVNLLMLVLVPAVFTGVAAGSIADAAKLLGGPGGTRVQETTAAWSAAFVAALAAYFQMRAARDADRRLVLAGLPPWRLAAARAATGLALAVLASAAAVVTLAARAGLAGPGRALAGTLLAALIYLAIGAVTGALVTSPVNGTVLIFFIWAVDVFFGPSFGSADRPLTWGFPTHFLTVWMTGLPARHAGPGGGLAWALAWAAGAVAVAGAVLTAAIRTAATRRRARPGSVLSQFTAGLRAGLRDAGRNRVLWALLAVVPVTFVALAPPVTPRVYKPVTLLQHGRPVTRLFWFPGFHPAIMAPIAIGFLAVLAGLFIITDARTADRRLTLAGFRPGTLLAARLTQTALAAALATAASLAVTAAVFRPRQWAVYAAASILIALTYALTGVIAGPLCGRVAGVFIAFLIPALDLGIAQDPMLYATPPAWAHYLPGYGPMQVLLNGALTSSFDQAGALLTALAWLAGLLAAATVIFRRAMHAACGPAQASSGRR